MWHPAGWPIYFADPQENCISHTSAIMVEEDVGKWNKAKWIGKEGASKEDFLAASETCENIFFHTPDLRQGILHKREPFTFLGSQQRRSAGMDGKVEGFKPGLVTIDFFLSLVWAWWTHSLILGNRPWLVSLRFETSQPLEIYIRTENKL